jgi:hypothetical protein
VNIAYRYIIISIITFICAFFFCALYNHWIICAPAWHSAATITPSEIIHKKQVVLHYFHGDKWKTEKQEMLWQDNTEKKQPCSQH